jgi:subtilisin family serine protease
MDVREWPTIDMTWTPPSPEDEALFPFPGFLGRGVRVAVIDSGVHAGHPHIRAVAGGVTVAADGTVEEGAFIDRLGHGTAVMAALQERAPEADYLAVKVFDKRLQSTAQALFRALEWCIECRANIVNLSLGTANPAHAERFQELVARALAAEVALISARTMEGRACFPGSLPGVFGVSLDEECERTSYRARETAQGLEIAASGYPRPAAGIPPDRNLQGISFAVANVSGFAARAMEGLRERSYEALGQVLVGNGGWG